MPKQEGFKGTIFWCLLFGVPLFRESTIWGRGQMRIYGVHLKGPSPRVHMIWGDVLQGLCRDYLQASYRNIPLILKI